MTLAPTRCLCGASETEVIGWEDERPVGRCARCALVRTCGVPRDCMALYTDGDCHHGGRAGHTPYRD